jgi:hypothetical protein
MTRFATMFAAVALIASPALASSYSARPATAPAAKKIIGKNISWACNAGACLGSTDASRPLVLCQDLAKRTGRLENFQVDGRALNAGELDKCNASAGNSAPAAAASN